MWSSPQCAFLLSGTTAPQVLPTSVCSLMSISRRYVFYIAFIVVFTGRVSSNHKLLYCGQSRNLVVIIFNHHCYFPTVPSGSENLVVTGSCGRLSQVHIYKFVPSCTKHFLSSCFKPGTILDTSKITVSQIRSLPLVLKKGH